jgi:hypothetical protein
MGRQKEKIIHLLGQSKDILPKKPSVLIYKLVCDHIIFLKITKDGERAARTGRTGRTGRTARKSGFSLESTPNNQDRARYRRGTCHPVRAIQTEHSLS